VDVVDVEVGWLDAGDEERLEERLLVEPDVDVVGAAVPPPLTAPQAQ
jgi:hypothetical protein